MVFPLRGAEVVERTDLRARLVELILNILMQVRIYMQHIFAAKQATMIFMFIAHSLASDTTQQERTRLARLHSKK
jgi:hypothetical protein